MMLDRRTVTAGAAALNAIGIARDAFATE